MNKLYIGGIEINVADKQEIEGLAADQTMMVLCVRVDDKLPILPTAQKDICNTCGNEVWISSVTKMNKPENSRIICIECLKEKLKEVKSNVS
jgi:formylmethanofuran dehydrogenase subunit E